MKLQGRNLAIQMHGEDVKLLQTDLHQLGYTISQDELGGSFFASTTQQAVSAFQRSNRLLITGTVDETTAELINTRVDALQPQWFNVHGSVTRSDGAPLADATVAGC